MLRYITYLVRSRILDPSSHERKRALPRLSPRLSPRLFGFRKGETAELVRRLLNTPDQVHAAWDHVHAASLSSLRTVGAQCALRPAGRIILYTFIELFIYLSIY